MTLVKDADLRRVVKFITTLRGAPSEPTIQGDTDAGKSCLCNLHRLPWCSG